MKNKENKNHNFYKKFFCLISLSMLICCYILIFFNFSIYITNAEKYYYAKIQKDNVYFYSSPIDNNEYMLFEIPNSYFVKLLDKEDSLFYYAQYNDQFGYVKIDDVVAMNGTPQSPYFISSICVYNFEGLGLYSSPYQIEENKLVIVPHLSSTITYYGKIYGQEAIPNESDIWYYCKYTSNSEIYGYVYSEFCYNFEQPSINNEYFTVIGNPNFNGSNDIDGLSTVAMTFIIIGVSIPCLIVIYLLVKPSLLKEKVFNNHPKIDKKKRHGDYYEFDESDLN